MEKNCKWHFDESGQALTGPNDSIHETFKANPYYSIVRESIQNSLDAVFEESEPVKIVFSFDKIKKDDYPNLFDLKTHITACLQTHRNDKQAEKLFNPMASYIDKNSQIEILKISDYNTKGMDYDSSDYNSGFTSFVRAEGKSSKNDKGSGGSFGFGKGAYYVLSKIKTLIVSTRTDSGKVFFEGKTRLATHRIGSKIYTRDGFYNKDYCNPVFKESDIPDYFKRTKSGTDVYVVGLIKLDDRKSQMIKSVLNNFWLAVQSDKLIVQVDDVLIDNSTLENLIDEYFLDEFESGTATDIESWNPKPYFKAFKYAGVSEQYKLFQGTLDTLGDVMLYVYLEKGLPNRTSYFRKPRMVVFKKTSRKVQGYAAVFLCVNKKGNEILKEMENPAHNEWKKGNYLNENSEPHLNAKKAEREISDFINSKLDDLSKTKSSKKLSFQGLEDYLAIPEDLLEKEEDYNFEGNNKNTISGGQTNLFSEDETGSQTTDKSNLISIKPTIKQQSDARQDVEVLLDDEGDLDISVNGKIEGTEPTLVKPGPMDDNIRGSKTDEGAENRVLLKVKMKVAAQKENGHLYHNLLINAEKYIPNAELELLVGADNNRDGILEILTTDNGIVSNNKIKNVPLNEGRNTIKIRFADSLKHAVKLKVYEFQ